MQRFRVAHRLQRSLFSGLLIAAGCADLHEAEPDGPNADTSGDISDAGGSAASGAGGRAASGASVPTDAGAPADASAGEGAAADAAALPLGVYHMLTAGDPANFELKGGSLSTYRWAMQGCDYGFQNAGVWKREGGRIVLLPPPGTPTFQWIGEYGVIQALEVELESGPEPGSLIARVEWDPVYRFESPELQRWDSGGLCSVCDPTRLCSCTQQACVDPF